MWEKPATAGAEFGLPVHYRHWLKFAASLTKTSAANSACQYVWRYARAPEAVTAVSGSGGTKMVQSGILRNSQIQPLR